MGDVLGHLCRSFLQILQIGWSRGDVSVSFLAISRDLQSVFLWCSYCSICIVWVSAEIITLGWRKRLAKDLKKVLKQQSQWANVFRWEHSVLIRRLTWKSMSILLDLFWFRPTPPPLPPNQPQQQNKQHFLKSYDLIDTSSSIPEHQLVSTTTY